MEPTKQVHADPWQPRDGPSPGQPPQSPLVEKDQATPPPSPPNPPQLLQRQDDDIVGGSSTSNDLPSERDLWGFDNPGEPVSGDMTHPDSQGPSIPNFINIERQPCAAAPFFASGHYTSLSPYAWYDAPFANQPPPFFDPYASASTSHWASMPSSSANGHQPGGAAAFSPRGHYASLDPHASAHLIARASQARHALWSFVQSIRFLPNEQFRDCLLRSASHPALVMTPGISERLVSMLNRCDQDLRLWVLQAVRCDVHTVMGNDAGSAVFLALLRAVMRMDPPMRMDELHGIVQDVASPRDKRLLMAVANYEPGEIALNALFRVVAQTPQLCRPLFKCLVDGWIMEQSNGPRLLGHCFTTLDYYYCRKFIRHLALPGFAGMVTSKIGWRCMVLCLKYAKHDVTFTYTELPALEQTILSATVDIAKTQYGKYFLLEVFRIGGPRYIELMAGITDRIEQNLRELSTNHFGNRVVQACYVPPQRVPELPLLQRGLQAFCAMGDAQLLELVLDCYGRWVLCKLLNVGRDTEIEAEPSSAWTSTVALARKIQRVLEEQDNASKRQARRVMRAVRMVFSAQRRR